MAGKTQILQPGDIEITMTSGYWTAKTPGDGEKHGVICDNEIDGLVFMLDAALKRYNSRRIAGPSDVIKIKEVAEKLQELSIYLIH